jgi:hypothetical protein
VGRMARIEERDDIIELSSSDRMHVDIKKVVVASLFCLNYFNMSHDLRAKYYTVNTVNI